MTNAIPTPIPNPKSLTPNRATGPRTAAGKQRSSQNALTHGLTAASPVLATEDPAAYQNHCRQFFDEYQPATPTEAQLTQELADTAWRINRIPSLEAALLDRAANPPTDQAAIDFDIVDAHRALATLGLHYQRLSRSGRGNAPQVIHDRRQNLFCQPLCNKRVSVNIARDDVDRHQKQACNGA